MIIEQTDENPKAVLQTRKLFPILHASKGQQKSKSFEKPYCTEKVKEEEVTEVNKIELPT